MKILILNTKLQTADIYNCKTDAASHVGVTTKSLREWNRQGDIKAWGDYLIHFNVNVHKASQKAHNKTF